MVLLVCTVFLLCGRNLNLLVGPSYEGSDAGLNSVLFLVGLFFLIEFSYNVVIQQKYPGSFYFYMDLLVLLSILPDAILFFDGNAFDSWNDDGPWSYSSIRSGALATGIRYFGDIVRVFKVYSLTTRSWSIIKLFTPRRETVVGRLVSIGIKQKVFLVVLSLLFLHPFLTIVSRTYDFWPQQTWDDELRKMRLFLAISGGIPTAEPFLSFATRWISHHNCQDGIRRGVPKEREGMRVVLLDDVAEAYCYIPNECPWPVEGVGSNGPTLGCRVRYLRVNGIDIWGEGPSGLTWMRNRRAHPLERAVVFLQPLDKVDMCAHSAISADRGVLSEALSHGTVADATDPIDGDPCTMAVIDTRNAARSQALKSVLTVLVLVLLLGTSNYLFHEMARRLVVEPILEMVDMVKAFSEDPMATIAQSSSAEMDTAYVGSSDTRYIGQALVKLSKLLQVAFGEAGAHVIQANLASEKAINPMVPGSRQNMIFGFCDIRSFTTCTEGLQDEVMVYVNKIADYVHVAVEENDGHPNKNIGDAFQVAWQLPKRGHLAVRSKQRQRQYMGDSALRSFLRVMVETSCCPKLLRIAANPEVQTRIQGYTTKLGFGLHAGWAIEGAVGSEHKIDPAWLSPHVKWAERLEIATKLYKVPLLMTDAFREHLSPTVQRLCRRVDRIKVPDASMPMDLYTYDVRAFDLEDMTWPALDKHGGASFFSQFPPATRPEWARAFQAAVSAYAAGDWGTASSLLLLCQREVPDDGPTERVLAFMRQQGGEEMVCPQTWKGYRETDEF